MTALEEPLQEAHDGAAATAGDFPVRGRTPSLDSPPKTGRRARGPGGPDGGRAFPDRSSGSAAAVEGEIIDLIPALRAFARSLTANAQNADDLVQDTLVKALSNIDKFQPGTRLRAWLFTIMRNTFYTTIRKSQRETTGGEDCVAGSVVSEPTQEWSLRGGEVMRAIGQLPPHYRETLVLVTMLGEPYEDAAKVFGCTVGTIKSRINRARLLVRQIMGEAP